MLLEQGLEVCPQLHERLVLGLVYASQGLVRPVVKGFMITYLSSFLGFGSSIVGLEGFSSFFYHNKCLYQIN